MANALWITLIGMGLVFIAILLLWGGMALLVRLTAEREPAKSTETAEAEAAQEGAQEAHAPSAQVVRQRRAKAAAAAVSVALALRQPTRRAESGQPDGTLSAWQAVTRGSQINQALSLPRKKVVR